MNPWLRLALFFGILVVSVLLLRLLPPLVVLALFVGGVAGTNYVARTRQRAEPEARAAGVLGLERVGSDRAGLLGLPFALLGRGEGVVAQEVMRGPWGGTDVTVFDLVLSAADGGQGTERALTCAVAPARTDGPHLVVEPRALLLPAVDLPDVLVGPERFRQSFDVRCRDAQFASSFLDAERTGWLLAQGERWGFELQPGLALLYTDRVPVGARAEVLDALAALLEVLPSQPADGASAPTPPRPDIPTA